MPGNACDHESVLAQAWGDRKPSGRGTVLTMLVEEIDLQTNWLSASSLDCIDDSEDVAIVFVSGCFYEDRPVHPLIQDVSEHYCQFWQTNRSGVELYDLVQAGARFDDDHE